MPSKFYFICFWFWKAGGIEHKHMFTEHLLCARS